MIPTNLQNGLKKKVEEIFSGDLFNNPDSERVSLSVFEQHLPEKSKDDISHYPYVIIQLSEGEQASEISEYFTKVLFIIGVVDEGSENQGHEDVVRIINKIFEYLSKFPLIDGQFELKFPIRWAIHEEETAPYYFGAVETTWSIPKFSREDLEAFI